MTYSFISCSEKFVVFLIGVGCLSHIRLHLSFYSTESQFIQAHFSPPQPGISGETDLPLAAGVDLIGFRALVLLAHDQLRMCTGPQVVHLREAEEKIPSS